MSVLHPAKAGRRGRSRHDCRAGDSGKASSGCRAIRSGSGRHPRDRTRPGDIRGDLSPCFPPAVWTVLGFIEVFPEFGPPGWRIFREHVNPITVEAARRAGIEIDVSFSGTTAGFRTFSGRGARELKDWLFREAELAVSNEDIARRFVTECRRTRTVLPATSTIERLCAIALVDAERLIETRIAGRLPIPIREQLLALLEETADDRVTRFVWLRQFEPGSNSSSGNRLLDRLEYLQRIDLPKDMLTGVPAHRVTRLRRQGERYYADGMRDLPDDRRLAILAVCASEWQAMLPMPWPKPTTGSWAGSTGRRKGSARPRSPTKRMRCATPSNPSPKSAEPWSTHRMTVSHWAMSSQGDQAGTASKPLSRWQPD